jgi:hypothetical protein
MIQFNDNVSTFLKYVKTYKREACVTLEFITLIKHIHVHKNMKGVYKIGDLVKHKYKLAYIVDYIHTFDVYEIKYNDASVFGETYGWFKHTEFNSTEQI